MVTRYNIIADLILIIILERRRIHVYIYTIVQVTINTADYVADDEAEETGDVICCSMDVYDSEAGTSTAVTSHKHKHPIKLYVFFLCN